MLKPKGSRYLAFDRDGTLITLIPYLRDSREVVLEAGAKTLVGRALELGYKTALITNQSVIGRGLATREQVEAVNSAVEKMLFADNGNGFDIIRYCPHLPSSKCLCRKPQIGLLEKEVNLGLIDLESSYYVGDCETDVLFANNLGLKSILVSKEFSVKTDASHVVSNLFEIVPLIEDIL